MQGLSLSCSAFADHLSVRKVIVDMLNFIKLICLDVGLVISFGVESLALVGTAYGPVTHVRNAGRFMPAKNHEE